MGLGAGMALTYLFTLMGTFAVAKENAVYNGNTNAVEYVEAKVFASTAEKLNIEFARLQAVTGSETFQVMKAPDKAQGAQLSFGKIDSRSIQQNLQWFPVTITAQPESTPSNQEITDSPSSAPESGCSPTNLGPICSIQMDLNTVDEDKEEELQDMLDDIATSSATYTVQDFIDLGVEVTSTARSAP